MKKSYGTPTQQEGWSKFERDLKKIEALFKKKGFQGRFYMGTFGDGNPDDNDPAEKNYCGTNACLGGWLAIVNPIEFNFAWRNGTIYLRGGRGFEVTSSAVYKMPWGFGYLFYDGINLQGANGLKKKIKQARLLLKYYRNDKKSADWEKFTSYGQTL